MSWLNHQELMLIRGIGNVPGETAAATTLNPPRATLDLLSEGDGIALETNGWSPAIPASKPGIWADSAVGNGRRLVSAADMNVMETMAVVISAGTVVGMAALMRELDSFAQRAREFWELPTEIEPTYISWWAENAPGKQYALIYNIDIAYTWGDSEAPLVNAVLAIEREPYWRAEVPPGDNPKRWTLFLNNMSYDTSTVTLTTTPLIAGGSSLNNMNEYSNGGKTALLTKNFVDVPAASIPGDAPALVWLNTNTVNGGAVYAGVKSTMPTLDTSILPVNSFNGPDATTGLGTDATIAADTGGVKAAGIGTAERVQISFATVTADALRLTFDSSAINHFIGNWAAFMRCRQVNGTAGQILMYLKYGPAVSATEGVMMPTTSPQVLGTTGNTAAWGLNYMGVLTAPHYNAKAAQQQLGHGLSGTFDLTIGVFASRSAGTGVLYIADVVLIPFDECAFNVIPEITATNMDVDTTGYTSRGQTEVFSGRPSTPAFFGNTTLIGRGLQFQPGRSNRVYFMAVSQDGLQSDMDDTILPRIHIVPRWRGIRAV